jgi:hypothetical protein
MTAEVKQLGAWWAVVTGEAPLRTPMGTPVVSRHRALAEEVAADVGRWGADPTAKTTTFSLQASYLDFGLRVKREVLEENTAAIWPDDLFVRRPEDARLAAVVAGAWGPPPALDRAAFREALRALTLRRLVASMTAGHVLRSAVLGWRVVTTPDPLEPAARAACGRWLGGVALAAGLDPAGAAARRHVPTGLDEPFCARCVAAPAGGSVEGFAARCALHPLLDKLRRWAAFPEETAQG